jgi:hypothetical protein
MTSTGDASNRINESLRRFRDRRGVNRP